jgi:hypothetical protein
LGTDTGAGIFGYGDVMFRFHVAVSSRDTM